MRFSSLVQDLLVASAVALDPAAVYDSGYNSTTGRVNLCLATVVQARAV